MGEVLASGWPETLTKVSLACRLRAGSTRGERAEGAHGFEMVIIIRWATSTWAWPIEYWGMLEFTYKSTLTYNSSLSLEIPHSESCFMWRVRDP